MSPSKNSDDAIKRGEVAERLLGNNDFQEFLRWIEYKIRNLDKVLRRTSKIEKKEIIEGGGTAQIVKKPLTPMEELLYIRGLQDSIEVLDGVKNLAARSKDIADKYMRAEKEKPKSSSNS